MENQKWSIEGLTTLQSTFRTEKGYFATIEGFIAPVDDPDNISERFDRMDTYWVHFINGDLLPYLKEALDLYAPELEEGFLLRIEVCWRRHCEFTYNFEEKYYDEVEYGDSCSEEKFYWPGGDTEITTELEVISPWRQFSS